MQGAIFLRQSIKTLAMQRRGREGVFQISAHYPREIAPFSSIVAAQDRRLQLPKAMYYMCSLLQPISFPLSASQDQCRLHMRHHVPTPLQICTSHLRDIIPTRPPTTSLDRTASCPVPAFCHALKHLLEPLHDPRSLRSHHCPNSGTGAGCLPGPVRRRGWRWAAAWWWSRWRWGRTWAP